MAKPKTIGRLNVRVMPDSSHFRKDLKATLTRVEKSASISATIKVTRKSLADVKRQIQALTPEIKVSLDVSAKAIKSAERKISRIKGTAEVATDVNGASSALSSARLAVLTRPRIARIIPLVDAPALAAAHTALAALSGGRVLGDFSRGLKDTLGDLDRISARAMTLGPSITTALAGGLASISGLAQGVAGIAAGLGAAAPAALVLPGAIGAAVIVAQALGAAFETAGEHLESYGPAFTEIKKSAGDAAWAVAGSDLTVAVERLLPVLSRGMREVGTGVGYVMSAVSRAASSAQGLRNLESIFASTTAALRPFASAAGSLVEALLSVGEVGASFLPDMGRWVADIADRFAIWSRNAADTGEMAQWIRDAVVALRTFGSILTSIGGIFSGLFSAMNAGDGTEHFFALARGLEAVDNAIKGPLAQGALQTIFAGASESMSLLGPGVSAIGHALAGLAPVISTIMQTSASAISLLGEAIGSILSDPAFATGLTAMFDGFAAGIQALAPVLGSLGPVLGSLGSLIGQIASTLGGVLGAAISALAPVIQTLAVALGPVIEMLGGALTSVIETLAPYLATLAESFSSVIEMIMGALGPALDALLPMLGPLLDVIISIASSLGTAFVGAIESLLPSLQPLLGVLAEIAPLLGEGLMTALDTLAPMLPMLAQAWGSLFQALTPLLPILAQLISQLLPPLAQLVLGVGEIFYTALIPAFLQLVEAVTPLLPVLGDLLVSALDAIIPLLPMLGDLLTQLIPPIIQAATTLVDLLIPVIEWLISVVDRVAPVLMAVVDALTGPLTSAFELAADLIGIVVSVLKGDWAEAWEFAKSALKNAASFIGESIMGIGEILGHLLEFVSSVLSDIASWFFGLGVDIVTGLIKGIASMAGKLVSFVKNLVKDAFGGIAGFLGFDVGGSDAPGGGGGGGAYSAPGDVWAPMLSMTPPDPSDIPGGARPQGFGGSGGQQTINIYNPVSEPSSETVRRNAQLLNQDV